MFQKIKVLLLAILFSGQSLAQEQSESTFQTDLSKHKWEVGLNVYPLLKGHDITVMNKYSPNQSRAYRLALSGSIMQEGLKQERDTLNNPLSGWYVDKSSYIGLTAGYEWRKNKGRRQFYFGGDINVTHLKRKYSYPDWWTGGEFGPYRNYRVAMIPFVGIKHYLTNWLSISAESNLELFLNIQQPLRPGNNEPLSTYRLIGITFTPLRFINLSYHF